MARPSTYSIVACDLAAEERGVAVQSKFLAAGAGVPAAEPHVGAIATQALANMRYGPDGLALLRDGLSAEEVVARLTEADDGREDRQLGVVDGKGRAATYTGSKCMDWAGGMTGDCYAAQGNILVSEETVTALGDENVPLRRVAVAGHRSEEHTSELQSHVNLVCRLLLEKKKNNKNTIELYIKTQRKQREIHPDYVRY